MKIFGTGLSGLVGSRIAELLSDKYEFGFSKVDITDREVILREIQNSNASVILHLAAKTDVDGCEEDKKIDKNRYLIKDIPVHKYIGSESGSTATAWKVNVIGTKNIADACLSFGKRLIYVSTDFVFDGENVSKEGYKEDNLANPINWYGETKLEGEKIMCSSELSYVIARIAYPYRADFIRKDFVRSILRNLRNGKRLNVITDHIMTPTLVDDIALALDLLIEANMSGIYHITGSQFITPYDAAFLIAEVFDLDKSLIFKTTREQYFKNRAPRPFNLSMNNQKISNLGIGMKSFEEGLKEIKRQI